MCLRLRQLSRALCLQWQRLSAALCLLCPWLSATLCLLSQLLHRLLCRLMRWLREVGLRPCQEQSEAMRQLMQKTAIEAVLPHWQSRPAVQGRCGLERLNAWQVWCACRLTRQCRVVHIARCPCKDTSRRLLPCSGVQPGMPRLASMQRSLGERSQGGWGRWPGCLLAARLQHPPEWLVGRKRLQMARAPGTAAAVLLSLPSPLRCRRLCPWGCLPAERHRPRVARQGSPWSPHRCCLRPKGHWAAPAGCRCWV